MVFYVYLEKCSGPAKTWPTRPFAMALFVAKKTYFIKNINYWHHPNEYVNANISSFATEQSQLSSDGDFCLFTSQMNDLFPLLQFSYVYMQCCLTNAWVVNIFAH